jgi:hypothetical protein
MVFSLRVRIASGEVEIQGAKPEIYETIDELPKIVGKVREALSNSQDRTGQEPRKIEYRISPGKLEHTQGASLTPEDNTLDSTSQVGSAIVGETLGKRGKAETSIILQQIENKLIPRGFFSAAKNTAEVRAQLERLLGLEFQSRKVSQALGKLYQKSLLKRTGSTGNFRYIIF